MKSTRIEKIPIFLLPKFRYLGGQKLMWNMIVEKVVEAFELPSYIKYNVNSLTQVYYKLYITSNTIYQFNIELSEGVKVEYMDIESSSTPYMYFEYCDGELFLSNKIL